MIRTLNASQETLADWHRLGVDGQTFATMSDEELRLYGLDQPLVRQLRNSSRTSLQKRSPLVDSPAQRDDGYVKFQRNELL